jgi:hypothetical protein
MMQKGHSRGHNPLTSKIKHRISLSIRAMLSAPKNMGDSFKEAAPLLSTFELQDDFIVKSFEYISRDK